MYIPTFVFRFVKFLLETSDFKESLAVANIVADEHLKLYALFSQQELEALSNLLRQSSLAILRRGPDPFDVAS